ncbi:Hsp70 family protein [Ornithinibacillus halophilus]|uniref:Chaperone protein DnaK n=1 Tax=Ornithinibacillus halophilus TaxID=930117 RepID=A0A1M5HJM7_9BACI|nr:Hsp70 family protein [Ornithinibacillus halophilus]SHG16179.1 molecular chaperone DnaK [Ornithinibacillus halophilus]
MAILGIDLGTTNSAMAYLKDEEPVILENKDGHRTTPSVFQIQPNTGEIIIGQIAKNGIATYANTTVMEVKRLMGTDEKVKVAGKEYHPEEIAARILKYLKEHAEDTLNTVIKEAVITVPAYFSDQQRKATQRAGELAGFKVERIINEPTAAAIAYGYENMDKDQNLLVYDLGGGTFDVSVVEIFEGVVEVKASAGNNKLGGMDFDNAILDWILEQAKKQHGVDLLTLGSEEEILQRKWRIKEEAENAKKTLSSQVSAQINLPYIAIHNNLPITLQLEITRGEFEGLIKDLADSTLVEVDKALEDAKLTHSDIHEVLLIGGSTRIPYVQEIVEKAFNKVPRKDINPDETVALGAAVQAGIKSGDIGASNGLMVTDVAPYTLGIEIVKDVGGRDVSGYFDPIIPRNTTIPTKKTKRYFTTTDNQVGVDISIYQGEQPKVEQNVHITSLKLDGVPPKPRGQESIDISFQYDINGNLQVEAIVNSTGNKLSQIVTTQGGGISESEVAAAKERLEQDWQDSELYQDVKAVIYRAEKVMNDASGSDKARIEDLLAKLKQALAENNRSNVEKYEDELTDLLIELV